MVKPTAIDLFAGAGGASVGYARAGINVIGAIEIDPDACASYRLNHKMVRVWQNDIRKVSPRDVMTELSLAPGQLDLLGACPPCQGFSRLRTRNQAASVDDSRNSLVGQFARYVAVLQPRTLMMENVPSLMDDPRFSRLINRLRSLGYQLKVDVLDASNFGVPQRRRRMILLGSIDDTPQFPRPARCRRTVRSAIHGLPQAGKSGDLLHDLPERRTEKVMEIIRAVPKDGGSRKDIPVRLQLACHRRSDGFSDVFGRMAWDQPAPTITSGCHNPSKGRFIHPSRNGAITLREAALIQTFPKGYKFCLSRGKEVVAAQIGNALPPELIRRLAKALVNGV